jgi:hypothetical protein
MMTLTTARRPALIAILILLTLAVWALAAGPAPAATDAARRVAPFPLADTNQTVCFTDRRARRACPRPGQAWFGQDASYRGLKPRYRDNGDGTVTDLNTGLMWQKSTGPKMTMAQARAGAASFRLAGYSDWRLPTIKELYSLIDFSGWTGRSARSSRPFINTRYFEFKYGDVTGERFIDAQWLSSTVYVFRTMWGNATVFGVNFADGRIKGYPFRPGGDRRFGPGRRFHGPPDKRFYVRYVRGPRGYGVNHFVDNHDGTVSDKTTGLMWMKVDSGHLKAGPRGDGAMNWVQALKWANRLKYAGYSDWRLPNARELQSIVDYTRSPDTTGSPAINPVFRCTRIKDALGRIDYPFYWTGTTHLDGPNPFGQAVYVAFGRAGGWMTSPRTGRTGLLDVHGAGAQRSDPKVGDPSRFPRGRGPQGDVLKIYNHVRLVRGGGVKVSSGPSSAPLPTPWHPPRGFRGGSSGIYGVGPGRPLAGRPGRQALGGGRRGFIQRLDRDGDGRVSRAEFDGPPDHFQRFDRNNNGYIDAGEAPTGPPPGRGQRPFGPPGGGGPGGPGRPPAY